MLAGPPEQDRERYEGYTMVTTGTPGTSSPGLLSERQALVRAYACMSRTYHALPVGHLRTDLGETLAAIQTAALGAEHAEVAR